MSRGKHTLKNSVSRFSREIVAEVLASVDIVDIVGASVELKPAGSARFKACCPFHAEKTPSFTVSRDRQQYYCFGCEKHGDAISFLVDYEGLSFYEALQKLADRSGIKLPAFNERDNKEDYLRSKLVELGKFAAGFFTSMLADPLKGSACRHYLKGRDLRAETVRRFGLGFAPDGWNNLVDKARAAGFRDPVLEASGLVKKGERGSLYDFFRNRLMIPIHDVSGNVVAFGGRELGDGTPKYMNSPENTLYKKSRVLYGLFQAREAMRREKSVFLVEGYFDLMRCFDAGIENVLATCGTALTTEQAILIRRYVRDVAVVFDADAAGIRAALRGIGLLTAAGLTVRAFTVPNGKDPDDFIKTNGPDAFRSLGDSSLDFVTFYTRMNENRLRTIEGRTEVAREVFLILTGLDDGLRRDEYLKRLARELQLNEWTVRGEFAKVAKQQTEAPPQRQAETPRRRPVSKDDRDFVAALLTNEDLRAEANTALNALPPLPGPLGEVLMSLWTANADHAVVGMESDDAKALYAAAATSEALPNEKAADLVQKRIASLRIEALRAEEQRLMEELRNAERSNDGSRVQELLRRKIGIHKQIENVGAA